MKKAIIALCVAGIIASVPIRVDASADTYLSEDIQEMCVEYGDEYGICPELIMALVETESSGRPNAENGTCKGLMQLNSTYHKDRLARLGVQDIFDADGNVRAGTDYLSELFSKYEDVALVLAMYHGEQDAYGKTERCDFSGYTQKILARSAELEREHGK